MNMEGPSQKAQILQPGTTYYRPYEGEIKGMVDRTLTILLTDFMQRIKNKWILVLEVLAWFFIVILIFMLYSITVGGGEFSSAIFGMYFIFIFIWLTLICTVGGSRLIADDMANNSMTLYMSRPIKMENYYFGKFGSIFLLISTISLLPCTIFAGLILGLSTGSSDPGYDVGAVVFTFIAVGFLIALVFSSIAIFFSSLTKNHLYAGVGIFCTIFFSTLIPEIVGAITRNKYVPLLSIWNNLILIADKWSGFNEIRDLDWPLSMAVLLLIVIFCNAFAWYRLSRWELSE